MAFCFGDYVLDTEQRELRRGAEPIALEPQVFDLLVYLVSNRGRVISKAELIDHVWGGRIVSDSALTTRLNAARKAVNDSGAVQRVIRTVARKGLRFVADVWEDPAVQAAVAPEPSRTLSEKPSIAVLPFANLCGDSEQEYFVDGVVEEIITALSHICWLSVIAQNSSFAYKGWAIDVKRVGRDLGARYVLEGSVRKAGDRVRVAARLIETTSGTHLWADRLDCWLEDVLGLQDTVAASVAGAIEPTLLAAEAARAAGRSATGLGAYDCYVRALAVTYPMTKEAIFEAVRLLEKAIAIDHNYGPALAFAATCQMQFVNYGWPDPVTARRRAVDLARRALRAARNDPDVIVSAAMVLAVFGESIGTMTALVDDVLALNPTCARGWYHSSYLNLMAGKPDRAIELAEVSLRLSPRARAGSVHTVIGASHFVSQHYDEAEATLLLALEEIPSFPVPYRYLAACYAQLGQLDKARDVVKRLRAITPAVMPPDVMYLRNSEHRQLYLSGLRRAVGNSA